MQERSPADVVRLVQEEGVEVVDFRFCDLPGLMQHFSTPAHALTEEGFEEGYGFDGSSIRGFQEIQESDMILVPDPNTAVIDPFREFKTLNLNCFVRDPVTGEPYSRDPRFVAKKAEEYLMSTGLADTAYFGPEAEFYIFDDVRFHQDQHSALYSVDSIEGSWNSTATRSRTSATSRGTRRGISRSRPWTFPGPPLRDGLTLEKVGIEIEVQHHEVATAGQAEIDMRFDTLLAMADKMMLYKYVNKSRGMGKSGDLHAQAAFEDNGSGMHCHQSLWKVASRCSLGDGYGGLSNMACWYTGGILDTRLAILAFAAPRPTRTSAWCRATRRR